jgi:S-adenosylmethionine:tRNA ribosyltransferase-isomerase
MWITVENLWIMINPREIRIAEYTYELPPDRIATHPLPRRDASRLLIYRNGQISQDTYRNIATHLPPGALIVFNNTRVIEARILFRKPSGAQIEVFCLEPHEQYPDVTTAMMQQGKVLWKCMIGGASKWKHGTLLQKEMVQEGRTLLLNAAITERRADSFIIEFTWTPAALSFADLLHEAGIIPLPPYIKRDIREDDAERYQTVYADASGSVAAPTAGLHFTEDILADLQQKNIQPAFVTLHVGAGTFKPVKTDSIGEHDMHAEFIQVNVHTIQLLLRHLHTNIIAVGTTSLRTIESLYWLGVKIIRQPSILPQDCFTDQWDAYDLDATGIETAHALQALLTWMNEHGLEDFTTKTRLLIVPGYALKLASILVTNFHQPQSTLLLLVAAVAGKNWKDIYQYALENNFRFLSYGDGCVIFSN